MMNTSQGFMSLPKQQDQLAHAYIVESNDVKKRLSNILGLVRSLLCQTEKVVVGDYCGHCHSCHLLNADTHPDFMMVNADGGTIGVDEVRNISTFLSKMSHLSGNQVIVIESAENMTESASNALLKTLEEPTDRSFIFLLCQSKSVLMPTILSRCQFTLIKSKTREALKSQFPELPDYILGFSNNSESELVDWVENDTVVEFTEVYTLFIQWLKNEIPSLVLINNISAKALMTSFLLYLLEKRIRQLMLKSSQTSSASQMPAASHVNQASMALQTFHQTARLIKGQNKALALTNLLLSIESAIK